MTRAELQALAERYLETWRRRDPVSIAGFHAIDGVVESPIYATLRGRKAIEDASRAFFTSFPDATLEERVRAALKFVCPKPRFHGPVGTSPEART